MSRDRQSITRRSQRASSKQKQSNSAEEIEQNKQHYQSLFVMYLLVIMIIAFTLSYFHFYYIYELFENDRHFSHLSTLERELSFRTEMGLYYSYFKEIAIDAPSFTEGFLSILSDNRTEAPTTINVLERFNLYPEVVLSFIYRFMNSRNMLTQICYRVGRGDSMSPVLSCEGHKEPTYFYVTCVFLLNGCLLGVLFLLGTYLSKSILGGLLTALAYMFNHGEATRIMWTPPLRESFSFPFHIVQLFAITYILQQQTSFNNDVLKSFLGYIKKHDIPPSSTDLPQNSMVRRRKIQLVFILCGSTVLYMLPWQFAQFTLATQLLSLGVLFIFNLLSCEQFFFILCTQILSLIISAILMFGNRMLLTSLFSITVFSFYLVCIFDMFFRYSSSHFQSYRLVIIVRRTSLFTLAFIFMKFLIIGLLLKSPDDDAHIWDILKSKLSSRYRTFDTQLYTCAKEFDFIELETLIKLCKTGLIPLSFIIIGRIVYDFLIDIFHTNINTNRQIWNYYHAIQAGAYILMGIFIMRLKLFPLPQLCLLTSLYMNEQFWPKRIVAIKKWKIVLFIVLATGMAIQGQKNIKEQLNIKGEYSNYPMERIVEWVNSNTANNSIFAGTMPTM
ncbi:unnamed protein product, partial [Adineta ricciae]